MSESSWQKLQLIFEKAVELPVELRADFLDDACEGDDELLKRVQKLLLADVESKEQESEFLSLELVDSDKKLIGTTIDGWKIIKLIGSGGMGSVFKVERKQSDFKQFSALKIVKKGLDSDSVVSRFRQERQILAKLNHPNIAKLFDGGITEDGRPYFVMELVEGIPINSYCDEQKLTIAERLKLFRQACHAVHYAHKNLVVHRDLKPSNIIVDKQGRLKLLDFGIAKVLSGSQSAELTVTGVQLHTPAYASPEQLCGETITTASDIYALGILFYELLSGRRPFELNRSPKEFRDLVLTAQPLKPSDAITLSAILDKQASIEPKSVILNRYQQQAELATLEKITTERGSKAKKLRKTLAGDLDTICLTAMHREPERRYASANEMAEEIKRHLSGMPILARPDSSLYRLNKFLKRHRAAAMVGCIGFILVIALSLVHTIQLTEQRDLAILERQKAEEVMDFLIGLFEVSDPSESKGETITARDLLDSGSKQIQSQLSSQPQVQQSLQRVLGEVYYKLGIESHAKQLLSETLKSQVALLGEKHLDVAKTQKALAVLHQERAEYEQAETLFQQALKTQRELLSVENFELVKTINAIGFFEQTRSNFDAAEANYFEALDIAKRITSLDHPQVAELMENLGGIYRILDRYDNAEKLLRDALQMNDRLYQSGPHLQISESKRELAILLKEMGRYEESKELFLAVIESLTKILGPDHRSVGIAWNGYGMLLTDMKDIDGAIEANKNFIGILERAYSGPHPALGAAYNNRAYMLKNNRDYEDAVKHFQLSIDVQNAIGLPENHINRSYPLAGMGLTLIEQEKYIEAQEILLAVLALRREAFDESHTLVTTAKRDLATSLIGLKEYSRAEKILLECYQQFVKTRGENDRHTIGTVKRLIKLYRQSEDTNKLDEYQKILVRSSVPN